jgi:hypothetical protein
MDAKEETRGETIGVGDLKGGGLLRTLEEIQSFGNSSGELVRPSQWPRSEFDNDNDWK